LAFQFQLQVGAFFSDLLGAAAARCGAAVAAVLGASLQLLGV